MKYCILLLMVWMGQIAFGQDDFKIVEEGRSMQAGTANALVLTLPKASAKLVKKNWAKYAKKFKGKLKYDGKVGEYFLDDATVSTMSDNTLDITTKIYDKASEGSEIAVWFNFGITYLDSESEPERYAAAEVFMKDFYSVLEVEMIKEQLKEEKKLLAKMEKERKKLDKVEKAEQKKIEKQQKIIAKAEEAIKTSEEAIATNQEEIDKQDKALAEKEAVIETIKTKLKNAGK